MAGRLAATAARMVTARRWLAYAAIIGISCALAVALPRLVPQGAAVEQWLADWRLTFFSAPSEPRRDIVLIKIDEETLEHLPYRSPIDRGFLADVLDRLALAQVKAVAIDILLDRPTEPEKDARLKDRLKSFPAPVMLAWADPGPAMTAQQSAFLQSYLGDLGRGYANLLVDPIDGTVRWVTVRHENGLLALPGLAAGLAQATGVKLPERNIRLDYVRAADPRSSPIPSFSAWQVKLLPPQFFAGRLVLIGGDYVSEDRYRTPFAAGLGDYLGRMPGVMIHAQALAQLIDGRQAVSIGTGAELVFVLLAALSAMLLATVNVPVLARIGFGIAALCGLIAIAAAAFPWLGIMLPVFGPAIALVLSGATTSFYQQRRFAKERAFIREALRRYVPNDVVKMLEADPGKLKLGGERRAMTFLFTDVAGFTSLAERSDPAQLVAALNAYLDGMSRIVLQHGGMLDKYIGDAVVAVFGAFRDDEPHAEMAVTCGLALDRFALDFAQRSAASGLAFGQTRIGINTGTAIIGNIGGEERFDFTAIGDPVNVASRLEGANKFFGTRIVAAETTVALCRGGQFRPVGEIQVKGKEAGLKVYQPLAADDPAIRWLPDYLVAYEQMAKGAGDAAAAYAALHELAPTDPLVRLHRQRFASGEAGARIVLLDK